MEYITHNIPYDFTWFNNKNDVTYLNSSTIFSIPDRNKAMCVGFSLFTSRALKMLGIPAYISDTIDGLHEVTRAYFNGQYGIQLTQQV